MKLSVATFAAGCFWGVEELFRTTPGVLSTRVGYTGGATTNPTYDDVCSDETGHAEAVEITYDPKRVSYERLLELFFENHNPCEVNRQGPDVGSQYRSAVFYHDVTQQRAAETAKRGLTASGRYNRSIATQIVPASEFYPAEEYHQQYLMKRGKDSCHW
jgi:peptide-methionine (S)-S-oxide reductase